MLLNRGGVWEGLAIDFEHAVRHERLDDRLTDRIDANPAPGEFQGGGPGESQDRMLAGRVRGGAGKTDYANNGGTAGGSFPTT